MATEKKIITADQAAGTPVNRDQPITGGDNKLVINNLQVRQVIRQSLDITNYKNAIQSAESRYYPNRSLLYDIYTNALLDGHLQGVINKRIDTVLNKPLFYKDKNGKIVEDLNQVIQSYEFRRTMRIILESIFWGISGLEFIPGPYLDVRSIPRKHIKTKTQTIAIEQNQLTGGFDYTKLDNVWIVGEDEDLGLLLSCALYVIYKRNALGDWAQFVEVFGMPIRIAKYNANDEATRTALEDFFENAGSNTDMLIPKEAELTIEDGKTSNANGDLQAQFIDMLNQEVSIIVLGNTETTTNGKTGSQAKSKVHQEQQNQIAKSDIMLLQAYLNDPHFIRILQSYGLPVSEEGNFEFNKDIDIEFLKQRIEVDKALVEAGVPIGADYFYETYNIPKPEATEEEIVPEAEELTPEDQETGEEQEEEPAEQQAKPTNLADNIDYSRIIEGVVEKLKPTNFFD